jgi:hypothetical protein
MWRSSPKATTAVFLKPAKVLLVLLTALDLAELTACGAESLPVFEEDIRPLLKAHCWSCHGEDPSLSGGLDLRLVRFMLQGGDSGPALATTAAASVLWQRVSRGEMPPEGNPPLTAAAKDQLRAWIEAGAPTRSPEPATIDHAQLTPDDRAFWSFQPLKTDPPAAVRQSDWPVNPIDQYLLAALEQQGVLPSMRADARTRVRRLSYALRGLPPTWDEVEQFSEDPSDQQYEALVDRWLLSPETGERWARVWLDLVRYVDQTPDYLNSAERGWLYRDWVVRSFQDDRPYDDFVRKQLAADFDSTAVPSDLAALGWLGLSPTYWKELRLAPAVIEAIVADEWDERIDTFSRTFLGLTVSCARCHHHKFDAVTQQDYTALAGVFASSQLAERPLLPSDLAAPVMAARAEITGWQAQLKLITDPKSPAAVALRQQIADREMSTPHYSEPWAHVVEEASLRVLPAGGDATQLSTQPNQPRNVPLFRRGDVTQPGEEIPRGFLEVLSTSTAGRRTFTQGSGRGELAEAVLSDAAPLLARVWVNRIWAAVFGKGLVSTPSDFGRQGDRPSQPVLLDYLASELIRSGWSTRHLVREIVLSATFQQASDERPDLAAQDPDNRLWGRMVRRRLDVEPWRDTVLSVTEQLDDGMFGPAASIHESAMRRRTLYGKIVREELDGMLRLFDFPEPSGHSPARDQTSTPLQQLFVLNGPLLRDQSRVLADNWFARQDWTRRPTDEQIQACYQQLFQRPAEASEVAAGIEFLRSATSWNATPAGAVASDSESLNASPLTRAEAEVPSATATPDGRSAPNSVPQLQPTRDAWASYLQVLLGLNELLYVD